MATSKRLFTVQCPHGPGGVFFSWQRASGGYLATTGYDQIVNIYNRYESSLFWILFTFFSLKNISTQDGFTIYLIIVSDLVE